MIDFDKYNPIFTLLSACFSFSLLIFNPDAAYCVEDEPSQKDVEQLTKPLHWEWTSKNGKHQRSGTLKDISSENCLIVFSDGPQTIERDLLSEPDRLFIAAFEYADLDDPVDIAEAKSRISSQFNFTQAARKLVGASIEVKTQSGEVYSCEKLLALNPRRAKFLIGKTKTRHVDLKDFDKRSKFILLYNHFWEAAYRNDLKQLTKIRDRARGNYRVAKKCGQLDSQFIFPIGTTATSKSSWGLEWTSPCIVQSSVVSNGFSENWHDDYFGGWENFDARTVRKLLAESKKKKRKASARSFKTAQRNYLANRSYSRPLTSLRYNGPVHVRGHYRNGSWVRPHTRSYPRR